MKWNENILLAVVETVVVADQIFVAGRRARPVEKKSVMWRNFKILYMKHVEKAKICPHVD